MRSFFELFILIIVVLLILGVVELFSGACAELQTAVRTYLL